MKPNASTVGSANGGMFHVKHRVRDRNREVNHIAPAGTHKAWPMCLEWCRMRWVGVTLLPSTRCSLDGLKSSVTISLHTVRRPVSRTEPLPFVATPQRGQHNSDYSVMTWFSRFEMSCHSQRLSTSDFLDPTPQVGKRVSEPLQGAVRAIPTVKKRDLVVNQFLSPQRPFFRVFAASKR